jgi:O-antigen/teichoic acid export membrane protein
LLMSLRAPRKLFFSVTIRAGLIALLGLPFGAFFGLNGVMAAVFLAFAVSSTYLFVVASNSIQLPSSQSLFQLLLGQPSLLIPFAWATSVTIVWIASPNISDQPFMLLAYAMGLLSTVLLVLRYSDVRFLLRTITDLKP